MDAGVEKLRSAPGYWEKGVESCCYYCARAVKGAGVVF